MDGMIREELPGRDGCPTPCLHNLTGKEELVCIVSHGLGSSKSSPTTLKLARVLASLGAGVLAYDFPGHGDSASDGTLLSVDRCLSDLAAAEQRAHRLAPRARIGYFASSFGAYINLLYMEKCPHLGNRAFLRSAAVELPALLKHEISLRQEQWIREGAILLDLPGYTRPLRLTSAFLAELDSYDLFQTCRPHMARVALAHGGKDDVASPKAARRLAVLMGAAFTLFPEGDHSLNGPGIGEEVLRLAGNLLGAP